MVGRVGSQEPFARARRDLLELAGLCLTGKRVVRSSQAGGAKIRAAVEQRAEAVAADQMVPHEVASTARPLGASRGRLASKSASSVVPASSGRARQRPIWSQICWRRLRESNPGSRFCRSPGSVR